MFQKFLAKRLKGLSSQGRQVHGVVPSASARLSGNNPITRLLWTGKGQYL